MSNPIADRTVDLLRNIHPTQLDADGVPTRTAFTPTEAHGYLLSTHQGRIGAGESFRRHTEDNGLRSSGVQVFSAGDALDAGCSAIDDADDKSPDHVSVDFRGHSGPSGMKQAGRKLREAASRRGWQYRP